MSISYSQPLSSSFAKMKKALFQPFTISKWINIGFTAFLAGLTNCNGGSGGNMSNKFKNSNWDDFFTFPETARNWLIDNPFWLSFILVGIVFVVIVSTLIIWVSSRGKFMFLYNVANDDEQVKKPWSEYRKEGNSLFLWEFIFGWFSFILFIFYLVYCFGIVKNMHYGVVPNSAKVGLILGMVLTFICYWVIVGYISLFLKDFVVPIMYKHRLSVLKAWSKFISLAAKNKGSFIVYGLFIFVLGIAVAIGIGFVIIVTCCIGLLILAIPFVGAVVLLPISYTFRRFSIEFLAQFGDDFNVLPADSDEEKVVQF